MNPHFLFNALGSIQYYIQTENIDKADDYLSDFAQLMPA
ncbi:MAG: histidine kinase [Saprospiraceae bacterium]|nr:histidine kinase [Candidatus Brachybacter algidus]